MNLNFRAEQLILLGATFLFLNFMFFIPTYYSFNIDPGHCDQMNRFQTEFDYQEDLCDSIFQAWRSYLSQREDLKPLLIPLLMSIVVTAVYSYYEVLQHRYREMGV